MCAALHCLGPSGVVITSIDQPVRPGTTVDQPWHPGTSTSTSTSSRYRWDGSGACVAPVLSNLHRAARQ